MVKKHQKMDKQKIGMKAPKKRKRDFRKHLPKETNLTDTGFKAKKIKLLDQHIDVDSDKEEIETILLHLGTSNSIKNSKEILQRLRKRVAGEDLKTTFLSILRKLTPLLIHEEDDLMNLASDVIITAINTMNTDLFAALAQQPVIDNVKFMMFHLKPSVQRKSLEILHSMLEKHSKVITRCLDIVFSLMDMISKPRPLEGLIRTRILKNEVSAAASAEALRMKVLEYIETFLGEIVKVSPPIDLQNYLPFSVVKGAASYDSPLSLDQLLHELLQVLCASVIEFIPKSSSKFGSEQKRIAKIKRFVNILLYVTQLYNHVENATDRNIAVLVIKIMRRGILPNFPFTLGNAVAAASSSSIEDDPFFTTNLACCYIYSYFFVETDCLQSLASINDFLVDSPSEFQRSWKKKQLDLFLWTRLLHLNAADRKSKLSNSIVKLNVMVRKEETKNKGQIFICEEPKSTISPEHISMAAKPILNNMLQVMQYENSGGPIFKILIKMLSSEDYAKPLWEELKGFLPKLFMKGLIHHTDMPSELHECIRSNCQLSNSGFVGEANKLFDFETIMKWLPSVNSESQQTLLSLLLMMPEFTAQQLNSLVTMVLSHEILNNDISRYLIMSLHSKFSGCNNASMSTEMIVMLLKLVCDMFAMENVSSLPMENMPTSVSERLTETQLSLKSLFCFTLYPGRSMEKHIVLFRTCLALLRADVYCDMKFEHYKRTSFDLIVCFLRLIGNFRKMPVHSAVSLCMFWESIQEKLTSQVSKNIDYIQIAGASKFPDLSKGTVAKNICISLQNDDETKRKMPSAALTFPLLFNQGGVSYVPATYVSADAVEMVRAAINELQLSILFYYSITTHLFLHDTDLHSSLLLPEISEFFKISPLDVNRVLNIILERLDEDEVTEEFIFHILRILYLLFHFELLNSSHFEFVSKILMKVHENYAAECTGELQKLFSDLASVVELEDPFSRDLKRCHLGVKVMSKESLSDRGGVATGRGMVNGVGKHFQSQVSPTASSTDNSSPEASLTSNNQNSHAVGMPETSAVGISENSVACSPYTFVAYDSKATFGPYTNATYSPENYTSDSPGITPAAYSSTDVAHSPTNSDASDEVQVVEATDSTSFSGNS